MSCSIIFSAKGFLVGRFTLKFCLQTGQDSNSRAWHWEHIRWLQEKTCVSLFGTSRQMTHSNSLQAFSWVWSMASISCCEGDPNLKKNNICKHHNFDTYKKLTLYCYWHCHQVAWILWEPKIPYWSFTINSLSYGKYYFHFFNVISCFASIHSPFGKIQT